MRKVANPLDVEELLKQEDIDVITRGTPEEQGRGKPFVCRLCKHKYRVVGEKPRAKYFADKEKCPSCGSKWCTKFKTERDLLELQDLYYDNNKDQKYLGKMYEYLFYYARSLILKKFSNVVYEADDLDYHAHSSATYLIEEFLKERVKKHVDNYKQFYITFSFGGILIKKIMYSIFGKQEHEVGDVSIDIEDEDKNKIMEIRETSDFVEQVINREDALHMKAYVESLIIGIGRYCDSNEENFLRLVGLRTYLMKGEGKTNKLYQYYNRKGKSMLFKTLEILNAEIRKSGNTN
jgi:hypothetical protein